MLNGDCWRQEERRGDCRKKQEESKGREREREVVKERDRIELEKLGACEEKWLSERERNAGGR